jgi:hypothetical protein
LGWKSFCCVCASALIPRSDLIFWSNHLTFLDTGSDSWRDGDRQRNRGRYVGKGRRRDRGWESHALFCFSFSGYHVLAGLSLLNGFSYHACLSYPCPGSPVSWLPCPDCLAPVVLYQLSCLSCAVTVVLSLISCPGFPVSAALSSPALPSCLVIATPSRLSCHGCLVLASLSRLS